MNVHVPYEDPGTLSLVSLLCHQIEKKIKIEDLFYVSTRCSPLTNSIVRYPLVLKKGSVTDILGSTFRTISPLNLR